MAFDLAPLKEILACPKSHHALVQDGNRLVCTSAECRLAYEVRDDIPVMLVNEAKELTEEEWKAVVDAG